MWEHLTAREVARAAGICREFAAYAHETRLGTRTLKLPAGDWHSLYTLIHAPLRAESSTKLGKCLYKCTPVASSSMKMAHRPAKSACCDVRGSCLGYCARCFCNSAAGHGESIQPRQQGQGAPLSGAHADTGQRDCSRRTGPCAGGSPGVPGSEQLQESLRAQPPRHLQHHPLHQVLFLGSLLLIQLASLHTRSIWPVDLLCKLCSPVDDAA